MVSRLLAWWATMSSHVTRAASIHNGQHPGRLAPSTSSQPDRCAPQCDWPGALTLRRLRNLSCLAPDVELVCIVNQVGPALTVADELTEQRGAEIANLVCVGAMEY